MEYKIETTDPKLMMVFTAIKSNNKAEVIRLLKKDKSLFKRKTEHQQTIFHYSAYYANEIILSVFIPFPFFFQLKKL